MTLKKKILYLITQSELGGAQRYVFDLATNLKNDFEITVAFGEPGETGELAKALKKQQIPYFVVPHLKRAISPLNDFLAPIEIIKLIKKFQPDIIHLNSSKISILGSIAFFISKIKIINWKLEIGNWKLIYTVHGWVFNEPLSNWKKLFYFYAEKFTARLKDKLICVSEFDRQIALKIKLAPEKKLITIHNGIAPISFSNKETAQEKLTVIASRPQQGKPGLPAGRNSMFTSSAAGSFPRHGGVRMTNNFTIGSIGNLYKTKGFKYLIQAGKILSDQKIDYQIIIIGDGPEKNSLQTEINKNGLTDKIILTGRMNNAAELLPGFDVYVCSSVKEGLSYTIMEAMQAGLPIVTTNVGGNGELIIQGRTGILVPAEQPEALAAAIIKLLNNTSLGQTYGQNARQKALAEFSLKTMVSKTKTVYDNL